MFEKCEWTTTKTTTDDDGRRTMGILKAHLVSLRLRLAKNTVFPYSCRKTSITKFDLATYQVSWKSACLFRRGIFFIFLPYMGKAAILVMRLTSHHQSFIFMYIKVYKRLHPSRANKPEAQWTCKRSPDKWASYKHKTYKT